jgi:putative transposase
MFTRIRSPQWKTQLLDISRGTVYYQPKPISPRDQMLINRIDRLHLEFPFAGARMLRDLLRQEDHKVGRSKIARLMRLMDIEALYRKPKTTKRHPDHKVYPYLLRNLAVTRLYQAWAMGITHLPMSRGFVYLAAVVDWHSRRVLSWKISTTLDAHFCLDAVEEAMERHGIREITNTDQGSQFTSQAFTPLLNDNDIQISMDGKGALRDKAFVEPL